jgi:hypothetical protein
VVFALDVSTNATIPRRGSPHPARTPGQLRRETGVLHFNLEGADPSAIITPEQAGQQNVHYLLGIDPSKWRTNVPTFGRIRYKAIYPGVDLAFYGNQTQLEYDFIVAPRADPRAIKMVVRGADEFSLDESGGLLVRIRQRTVRLSAPVAYQIINGLRREVPASFHLDQNAVSFSLGQYNADQALVIDPVLCYSTYLGGAGQQVPESVAVDARGNAYLCGYTGSLLTNLITPGAFQTNAIGNGSIYHCFIAKLDNTGTNLMYLTYLGGESDDMAYGIAVDPNGRAHLVGCTSSSDFPTCNALFPTLTAGYVVASGLTNGYAVFVAALDTNGSQLVFSTFYGSTNVGHDINMYNYGTCIALDSDNNIYIGGSTDSDSFPLVDAVQRTANIDYNHQSDTGHLDSYNGFIAKLSSNAASIVYSTY